MTGSFAETVNASLSLVAGIVAVSMMIGAVDLVHQPTWAWRAAGEPEIVCLLLVVLLPGVGLAIYVFGARPKVVAIARSGRAASLPFESFGDWANTPEANRRAIQALAELTTRDSFGAPIARPIRATQAQAGAPAMAPARIAAGTTFFDDPDVVSVAAADFFAAGGLTPAPMPPEAATGPSPKTLIRIPGQVAKA